jgi:YggT family protein
MGSVISVIQLILTLFSLIVLADILLRYILDPYNPVRQTLDAIVEPFLAPIRSILPDFGMIDLSPLVLIILIQIVQRILAGIG